MSLLEQKRKSVGITQEAMASQLGIGTSTYCQYENGTRNIPADVAEKICVVLGVPVEEIFLPQKFTVSKTKF